VREKEKKKKEEKRKEKGRDEYLHTCIMNSFTVL